MSFGFMCRKDQWVNENGMIRRELVDVEVCDVSPVTYAAYDQTSISVRSFEAFKKEQDELAKVRDAAKVKPIKTILDLIME